MRKAIIILSAFILLTQGTTMADHSRLGRERTDRGQMGYGRGYDCSSLTANTKLRLTQEQTERLRTLDEKYARELDPVRKQLYSKGQELKTEWLQTNPDRGRIETLQGEVAKLQEKMRGPLAAHHTEVLKVLTLKQRVHVPDYQPGRIFYKPAGLGQR
ncbi:MAG: periplasmic heavy metal sensor [Deltaproteobacteria bacterium]|nr:periplasmic heavy metal sensor [Deltaproteobacteria bacterium]